MRRRLVDTLFGERHDTVHFYREEVASSSQVGEISRVTWVGVAVNIFLAVFKSLAGLAAGSSALVADAVHTVSDLVTDAAVLIGVRFWSAPADARHPHGHQKIETLVTMVIGVALAAVGIGMGYQAVNGLADAFTAGAFPTNQHSADVVAFTALLAALVSLAAKEILYRWTVKKGIRLGSSAVIANAWHHRSDALSSIPPALAIGGEMVGSHYGYDLWFLDSIGTVVVCVMLLQAAWEIMQPTLAALLDSSADRQLCSAIRKTVLATEGVLGTHCIRTRVIGVQAVAVDLHITVDQNLTVCQGHDIAAAVKYRILDLQVDGVDARAVDVMVHVEPGDPVLEKIRRSTSNTAVDWKPKE